jgi:hypothetical protein
MDTVELKISLPINIYNSLKSMMPGSNINQIIVHTLSKKISNDQQSMNELLKEGYISVSDEDRELINDFSSSDLENWD